MALRWVLIWSIVTSTICVWTLSHVKKTWRRLSDSWHLTLNQWRRSYQRETQFAMCLQPKHHKTLFLKTQAMSTVHRIQKFIVMTLFVFGVCFVSVSFFCFLLVLLLLLFVVCFLFVCIFLTVYPATVLQKLSERQKLLAVKESWKATFCPNSDFKKRILTRFSYFVSMIC